MRPVDHWRVHELDHSAKQGTVSTQQPAPPETYPPTRAQPERVVSGASRWRSLCLVCAARRTLRRVYPIGAAPHGVPRLRHAVLHGERREHFDAGGFSLLYGSPFTYDYGTPRIYFQPLTLLLGLLGRLPGADPGVVFGLVGLVAAVVCVRIGIALFDRFASRATPSGKLALVAFFWGGGVVVLMGMLFVILPGPAGTKLAEPPSLSGYWWFTGLADPAGGMVVSQLRAELRVLHRSGLPRAVPRRRFAASSGSASRRVRRDGGARSEPSVHRDTIPVDRAGVGCARAHGAAESRGPMVVCRRRRGARRAARVVLPDLSRRLPRAPATAGTVDDPLDDQCGANNHSPTGSSGAAPGHAFDPPLDRARCSTSSPIGCSLFGYS